METGDRKRNERRGVKSFLFVIHVILVVFGGLGGNVPFLRRGDGRPFWPEPVESGAATRTVPTGSEILFSAVVLLIESDGIEEKFTIRFGQVTEGFAVDGIFWD
jgi:hypothetical protein